MIQLDPKKIEKLPTFNQRLDEQYGKCGTPEREKFNEESLSWFYGNMLKESEFFHKLYP